MSASGSNTNLATVKVIIGEEGEEEEEEEGEEGEEQEEGKEGEEGKRRNLVGCDIGARILLLMRREPKAS